MLQAEAKPAIIDEFSRYIADKSLSNPTTVDALGFYRDLKEGRPALFRFRCNGDPWQKVKGWLLQEGLVAEPHNRRRVETFVYTRLR